MSSYFELYETRAMLEDTRVLLEGLVRMSEAANFQFYAEKFPWFTKKEFDKLIAIDPTTNKMYSKWLVERYIKIISDKNADVSPEERKRLFFEDADALDLKGALELFNKITKAKGGLVTTAKKELSGIEWGIKQGTTPKNAETNAKIEELNQKIALLEGFNVTDIMTVPDMRTLIDLVEPFKKREDLLVTKKEAQKDYVEVYEGPNMITAPDGSQKPHFMIVSPKTHLAARKFGTDTTWCTATANSHYYDHYTQQGPLYIIIDWSQYAPGKRKGKWQIHIPSNQFKDADDREVDDRSAILSKLPPEAQQALSKAAGINVYTYELQDMFGWRSRQTAKDEKRIRHLLAAGASPHIENEAVLRWAIENHIDDIADQLIKDPQTDRKVLADLVADAASASNFTFVQKIVGIVGPDAINANGAKALVKAVQFPITSEDSRVYEKAKKAIKANSEKPQTSRKTPREAIETALGPQETAQYDQLTEKVKAFYEQALPIVQYFVQNGANVNAQNGEVLGAVCQWSNDAVLQLIEYLIQSGADVNANHSLAYWRAYNNFRPKVLKLLMAHGGKAA